MLVGAAVAAQQSSGRMLLLSAHPQRQSASRGGRDPNQMVRHEENPQQHHPVRGGDAGLSRGQSRPRQSADGGGTSRTQESGRRRRRLTDLEDVEFLVRSEGEGGEAITESQQAAAFMNNMANPVSDGWER